MLGQDPTELGTHLSSLACDCGGLVVPGPSHWTCLTCTRTTPSQAAHQTEATAARLLRAADPARPDRTARLLERLGPVLGPGHAALLELRLILLRGHQQAGDQPGEEAE